MRTLVVEVRLEVAACGKYELLLEAQRQLPRRVDRRPERRDPQRDHQRHAGRRKEQRSVPVAHRSLDVAPPQDA